MMDEVRAQTRGCKSNSTPTGRTSEQKTAHVPLCGFNIMVVGIKYKFHSNFHEHANLANIAKIWHMYYHGYPKLHLVLGDSTGHSRIDRIE